MCWCCRIIGQKICIFCDTLLVGTACLGGASTATTTALQYTGKIDNWRAIVIPSVVTFLAVLGCVLRCVCRTQTQTSVNTQRTIVVNQFPSNRRDSDTVAIPVEPELSEKVPQQQSDAIKAIHDEWRASRDEF